jgi:hypothetical protein
MGLDAKDAFAIAGERCNRIARKVLAVLMSALAAASLAACSEKPFRSVPDGERAYNSDSQLRERTLHQGESGRMGH